MGGRFDGMKEWRGRVGQCGGGEGKTGNYDCNVLG